MHSLKYKFLPIFLIAFIFIFTSCQNSQITSKLSAEEIAKIIAITQNDTPEIIALGSDTEDFYNYLTGYYNIEADTLEDGVIFHASDRVFADEFAVLKFTDEDDAKSATVLLEEYQFARTGDFTGYVPQEAENAENGIILQNGNYVALIICEDTEAAKTQFLACFEDNPPTVPTLSNLVTSDEVVDTSDDISDKPIIYDSADPVALPDEDDTSSSSSMPSTEIISEDYDHDLVLSAYKSGDASALNEKNKTVLQICTDAINSLITDDMTEYEKELAIHDFIVDTTDYDILAIGATEDTVTSPDNDNPYGTLVHKQSICSGYTSTFQLMMDMLEIECITVNGTAHRGTEEHAWNMVNLDGEWYFVDATWNDPTAAGQSTGRVWHDYFNVTSEHMKDTDHQWDEALYPTANSTTYSYKN